MAQPGLARPGDRSRRDDDRQLMLDAMLSARRVLYISWTGHSQRDNSEQPPSVLVAQLRDYLRDGWARATVDSRTTVHPLQAFSRRYFEPGGLPTYAGEWRAAHAAPAASAASAASATAGTASDQVTGAMAAGENPAVIVWPAEAGPSRAPAPAGTSSPPPMQAAQPPLTVQALADFLRNPVKAYFKHRLRVRFDDLEAPVADDEPFGGQGLERWALIDDVLDDCRRRWGASAAPVDETEAPALLARQLDRLQRAGRLPLAGPGRHTREALRQAIEPMLAQWLRVHAAHPRRLDRQRLHLPHPEAPALLLEDVLDGLRTQADPAPHGPPMWVEWTASRVSKRAGKSRVEARPDKLVTAWVRCLAAAACDQPVEGVLIGDGAWVQVRCPPQDEALQTLQGVMQAWREGMAGDRPLPTALRTGLAWLTDGEDKARKVYEGDDSAKSPGEVEEPSLARLFPDFDRLGQAEGFAAASLRLYVPYRQWLDDCTTVQAWDAHDDGEGDSDDD
jgi:exodeoxyribonuclease V gamma subunit